MGSCASSQTAKPKQHDGAPEAVPVTILQQRNIQGLPKKDVVPMLVRLRAHAKAGVERAIIESGPQVATCIVSYPKLLASVEEVSKMVLGLLAGRPAGLPKHVAYLVSPGLAYTVVELAVWAAGGTCIPLSVHSPAPELEYFLEDSDAAVVIADAVLEGKLEPVAEKLGRPFATVLDGDACGIRLCPATGVTVARGEVEVSVMTPGLILHTSGTTGRPKGVVHTFQGLTAQYESLTEAWQWSSSDHTLHVLPLHHIHGVQNILNTALYNGACVEFTPFDAAFCLRRLGSGDITCFHAVPTVYVKLIQHVDKLSTETRAEICKSLRTDAMRCMVSGSAALPVQTMRSWAEISGHVLLERYGMTEVGMSLSNKLHGTRYPGCVGWALPGVEVKLDRDGTILVKGAPVFREYYGRDEATKKEFTEDGWFKTGDNAQVGGSSEELQRLQDSVREVERATGRPPPDTPAVPDEALSGIYKILGRSSLDIIKSGGYKISALEIENELVQHDKVKECAVIGKPDEIWGEKVVALCVLTDNLTLEELRKWGKERLASYKVPQELEVVTELPRNHMGKLEKKVILQRYRAGESGAGPGVSSVSQAAGRVMHVSI
mmetsp:Transcript_2226/g.4991  ORF Transcript_2226/g.4991 Transcript_2226/m.4991 type:complete len:605 (+) Transcript_2226:87-1901(+)|eukprot:CAMPEP_0197889766 /NCGR_PEP_ID=MMETSP1439-20131203/24499_1 /TAXON_ID=66791 /ORGANISM="Gonyaulax spinifera, Strain CCMP409" /LENGTH=604 /DNA_ID=CAMNT_0043509751 /DNA_START=86 /DNA_END=1900 /DNA_ORIENTATION=+